MAIDKGRCGKGRGQRIQLSGNLKAQEVHPLNLLTWLSGVLCDRTLSLATDSSGLLRTRTLLEARRAKVRVWKHIEIAQAILTFRSFAGLFLPLTGRSSFLSLEAHDYTV
jgi:hypothetical protein